jgi:hypothetical protein
VHMSGELNQKVKTAVNDYLKVTWPAAPITACAAGNLTKSIPDAGAPKEFCPAYLKAYFEKIGKMGMADAFRQYPEAIEKATNTFRQIPDELESALALSFLLRGDRSKDYGITETSKILLTDNAAAVAGAAWAANNPNGPTLAEAMPGIIKRHVERTYPGKTASLADLEKVVLTKTPIISNATNVLTRTFADDPKADEKAFDRYESALAGDAHIRAAHLASKGNSATTGAVLNTPR